MVEPVKPNPPREPTICTDCFRPTSAHFFMCDRVDGEWCPECFEKTKCGRGKHGEGCPTAVFGE